MSCPSVHSEVKSFAWVVFYLEEAEVHIYEGFKKNKR